MTWNGAARSIGMSPGCVLTGAVFIFCIVIGWGECWASVMFVEHGCGRGNVVMWLINIFIMTSFWEAAPAATTSLSRKLLAPAAQANGRGSTNLLDARDIKRRYVTVAIRTPLPHFGPAWVNAVDQARRAQDTGYPFRRSKPTSSPKRAAPSSSSARPKTLGDVRTRAPPSQPPAIFTLAYADPWSCARVASYSQVLHQQRIRPPPSRAPRDLAYLSP